MQGKEGAMAEEQRKVPVVLLHGFAQTSASWDEVARALQGRGRRTFVPNLLEPERSLALDEPSCGKDLAATGATAANRTDGAGEDPLASLRAVCDRVAAIVRLVARTEGAPVLVGYSMGGRIAAETIVRHPDLPLAGLVLESAGLGPTDEEARAALARRNSAWASRLRDEGVAAFMDWWETLPLFASQRDLPASARAAIRAGREAHSAEALARSLEAWGAHHQATEAETLAALVAVRQAGLPVRYLVGACDAKYAAMADRVRAAGLPVVLIPLAGHNTHLEQPEAFLRGLGPFLA